MSQIPQFAKRLRIRLILPKRCYFIQTTQMSATLSNPGDPPDAEPRPRLADRWGRLPARGWLIGGIAALVIWGLTDVRDRGRPHPENRLKHRTDLTVYTEAGAAFFDGRPPYEVSNLRGLHYLYPPMFAMTVAPLHVLPSQDQVVVWFLLSLLACWGCCREGRLILGELCEGDAGLAGVCRRWSRWLAAAALAAGLFPTLNCLQRGQVGILKLYLMLLGLRLVLAGRSRRAWVCGGVVLSMPVALKIVPILPVALLLVIQLAAALAAGLTGGAAADGRLARARGRLVASGSGVALGLVLLFLVAPSVLVGWRANLGHLQTWSRLVLPAGGDAETARLAGLEEHTVRNQSLGNAVYRLGSFLGYVFADGPDDRLIQTFDPPPMAMDAAIVGRVLLGVRAGLLLALLAIGIRLGLCGDGLSLSLGFALACVAMLVVSPISRGHYFMFLVPAAVLLPLWLQRRGMPRAAAAMCIVPGLLSVSHYALLQHAGRVGLLGLGTTGWLVAAMVLVEMAARRTRPQAALPEVSCGRPATAIDRAA